jgi:hypothetical protein
MLGLGPGQGLEGEILRVVDVVRARVLDGEKVPAGAVARVMARVMVRALEVEVETEIIINKL